MFLRYTKPDGQVERFDLGQGAVNIGRSNKADLVLADEKASRLHCCVLFEEDGHVLRDLQSKNGTYLNGEKVEVQALQPGDRIRVGSTILTCEEKQGVGPNTALLEVEEKMAQGKGYGTILKEIVGDVNPPPSAGS